MRAFLKRRDPGIKLSGYGGLAACDLSRVLRPDDFRNRERLVLREVFGDLNLRRAEWLETFTDNAGRLRLAEQISAVTISQNSGADDYAGLVWNVARRGPLWQFHPQIGRSFAKRAAAERFARQWRVDEGRFCFDTSLERLNEIVSDTERFAASFPNLNYNGTGSYGRSTVEVQGPALSAWRIGALPSRQWTAEELKALLKEFGRPHSCDKGKLLARLAEHAAAVYEKRAGEIEACFNGRRFIKIASAPRQAEDLPVLGDLGPPAGNLVLAMYVLKHLRADAILDPAHENDSYTLNQLALVRLHGVGATLRCQAPR